VTLIEAVPGEDGHLFPQLMRLLRGEAWSVRGLALVALLERLLGGCHFGGIHLAHAAPQITGLFPTQAGDFYGHPQDLFLEE